MWNWTHFRHPTDEQLRQLDIYRSRTSDRGLPSSTCFGRKVVNTSGEAVRGLVKSRVEFAPPLRRFAAGSPAPHSRQLPRLLINKKIAEVLEGDDHGGGASALFRLPQPGAF